MDRQTKSPVIVPVNGRTNGSERTMAAVPGWPESIALALQQPGGARFYRCALQVNTPYQGQFKGFDSSHRRDSESYKRDYALALARQCKKCGIDVIGLCDHNNVDYLEVVRQELNAEGIFVFPGFEIASTEGLHILCLFDLQTQAADLDHLMTELGLPPKDRWVTGKGLAPRQSPRSFTQIIERVQKDRRGICIAAHIDSENGLLSECAKTTRVQYYTDSNLLAGQISGARADLIPFIRKVVEGELTHYQRTQPFSLLNCLDVYNLKDLGNPACSSWIRMSGPSIEGLWQAFLDPESRIRLLTEADDLNGPMERGASFVELVAMTWEGGFLDGCNVHFNENLNCLIGGRGAGKSTVIESLRYVLDQQPIGAEATAVHESILNNVIQSGTKISLLVKLRTPGPCHYVIERVYPGDPVIYDERMRASSLKVFDLMPHVDIFGQHEIAEIATDTAKQMLLLRRHRGEGSEKLEADKFELQHQLGENRLQLLQALRSHRNAEDQLSRLPSLEEKLRLYQELGLEAKLREQSLLAREERVILTGKEKISSLKKLFDQAGQRLQSDPISLEDESLEDSPNADLLKRMKKIHADLQHELQSLLHDADKAFDQAEGQTLKILQSLNARKQAAENEYHKILRELQREKIDGAAFIKLRKEIEALEPARRQHAELLQTVQELEKKRRHLLRRWQTVQKKLHRLDSEAAGTVTALLEGKVRVAVQPVSVSESLVERLKKQKLGARADQYERLLKHENLDLFQFLGHVRSGKDTLKTKYDLNDQFAGALTKLDEKVLRELEELDTPSLMRIELNVASPAEKPRWKPMPELSTGQKATAILLILFPEAPTPLIIDQPEDDLDNRFIADVIIPTLRQEKQKRQFIFATHNANLPVLGDAELIVGLAAEGVGEQPATARILPGQAGSIDQESVKLLVEQVLEGGRQAFETRRAKYGF